MAKLRWIHFPKSHLPTGEAAAVVQVFERHHAEVDSERHDLDSNDVLRVISQDLAGAGFWVETSKRAEDKVPVPVLFGMNGAVEKTFNADAFHPQGGVVVEIEAGRAVANNQFLKDLFQACLMQDVRHLVVAVRNDYRGKDDFMAVVAFIESLYASRRMQLPLEGVTIVGY